MAEAEIIPGEVQSWFLLYLKLGYVNTHIETLSLGIQLFMVAQGYLAYRESPSRIRDRRLPYVLVSFLILVLSILSTVLGSFRTAQQLLHPGGWHEGYETISFDYIPWFQTVIFVSTFVVIAIGDGLLVWRCYVLWSDTVIAIAPVMLVYLGSLIQGTVALIAPHLPKDNPVYKNRNSLSCPWVWLSAATNILVSGFIAYRLLRARRTLTRYISQRDLNVYSGAVAIVVEAALPFTLMAFAVAITLAWPITPKTAIPLNLFHSLWLIFGALSPQLIIYRVNIGQSFPNSAEQSQKSWSQPINFASDSQIEESKNSETTGHGTRTSSSSGSMRPDEETGEKTSV